MQPSGGIPPQMISQMPMHQPMRGAIPSNTAIPQGYPPNHQNIHPYMNVVNRPMYQSQPGGIRTNQSLQKEEPTTSKRQIKMSTHASAYLNDLSRTFLKRTLAELLKTCRDRVELNVGPSPSATSLGVWPILFSLKEIDEKGNPNTQQHMMEGGGMVSPHIPIRSQVSPTGSSTGIVSNLGFKSLAPTMSSGEMNPNFNKTKSEHPNFADNSPSFSLSSLPPPSFSPPPNEEPEPTKDPSPQSTSSNIEQLLRQSVTKAHQNALGRTFAGINPRQTFLQEGAKPDPSIRHEMRSQPSHIRNASEHVRVKKRQALQFRSVSLCDLKHLLRTWPEFLHCPPTFTRSLRLAIETAQVRGDASSARGTQNTETSPNALPSSSAISPISQNAPASNTHQWSVFGHLPVDSLRNLGLRNPGGATGATVATPSVAVSANVRTVPIQTGGFVPGGSQSLGGGVASAGGRGVVKSASAQYGRGTAGTERGEERRGERGERSNVVGYGAGVAYSMPGSAGHVAAPAMGMPGYGYGAGVPVNNAYGFGAGGSGAAAMPTTGMYGGAAGYMPGVPSAGPYNAGGAQQYYMPSAVPMGQYSYGAPPVMGANMPNAAVHGASYAYPQHPSLPPTIPNAGMPANTLPLNPPK